MNFKNFLDKTIFLWLPVFLWAMVIFLFSAMPTNPVSQIHWQDFIVKKSAHVIEYAIFVTFLYRALYACGIDKKKAGFYSILLAVFYGITDEFHQSFTPGRTPKARDVIFDTLGSISAIYLIWNYLPTAPEKIKKIAKDLRIM